MQVQPINNSNSQTFGALNLTSAAKTLIEQEKGGKAAIKQFTKELENSKWDLNIKTIGNDAIYPYFGKDRATCVIPSYVQDEYVMVYSSNAHSMDNEDDIVDCLKFPSKQRAKEVYDTLMNHFHSKNCTLLTLSEKFPTKISKVLFRNSHFNRTRYKHHLNFGYIRVLGNCPSIGQIRTVQRLFKTIVK